jgi:hypothetical protein
MNILFNGDSNMCGTELSDLSQGVAPQICNILKGTEINLAIAGASNDRIYNTTIEYLQNNPTPDLIVIGWSEFARVQWFIESNGIGKFYEINSINVGVKVPGNWQQRHQHWTTAVCNNQNYRRALSLYWHERIFNLHSYFTHLKIPHVFFNAFHAFSVFEKENQLDWNNTYLDPYDFNLTYIEFLASHGYKEITPGKFHFESNAQRKWAERVTDYIKQYKLTTNFNSV